MGTGNKSGVRSQESGVKDAKKTAIFYITDKGLTAANKLKRLFPDSQIIRFRSAGAIPEGGVREGSLRNELPFRWQECKNLIFIMATGIVVRAIAPLLMHKKTDPAVVVLDEAGQYVISLLSGHLGGANELAQKVAAGIGAHPVITTASDVQGKVALDLWAREKGLHVEDYERLKGLGMKMLNGQRIRLYSTCRVESVPEEIEPVDSPDSADMIVSEKILESDALFLRPRNLFAGIGCNRGTSSGEIEGLIKDTFREAGLSLHSLHSIATIDLKEDEAGLNEYTQGSGLALRPYPGDVLNVISAEMNVSSSEAVRTATGAAAVAEPAAVAAARDASAHYELLISKIKRGNVTLAIAKAESTL